MAAGNLPISRLSRWRRNLRSRVDNGAIYKPLHTNKQEFRLLELYAGSGEDAVLTQLRLTRFRLLLRPRYETISYCWGDPNRTATIQLNGKVVSVPASSVVALKCVRLPDRTRTIWIDALCINQSDVDERAQQVSMMSQIYSKSSCNLVCFEEANSFTERAVENINKIMTHIKERTQDFRMLDGTPFDNPDHERFFYDDVSYEVDDEALLNFFSNGWFRRVWAFQEAALASSNLCFIGHLHIDLQDILRAAVWIFFHVKGRSAALGHHQGMVSALILYRLLDRDFGYYQNIRDPNLANLLDMSCRLLATESHDHVYGLIGLWSHYQSKKESQLLAMLAPDYRKPLRHVFRDATRVALHEYGDLWLWNSISHLDEAALCSEDCPSWVIDLKRSFDARFDPARFSQAYHNACDNHFFSHSVIGPIDPDLIIFYGACLDQVIDVASILDLWDFLKCEEMESWASDVVTTVRKYVENATFEDIAMVLLAGLNVDYERATRKDTLGFADLINVLRNEHRVPKHLANVDSPLSDQERVRASFLTQLWRICTLRRVFITKTGYTGIGPKLTRAGDNVVILYGGRMPLVLRPRQDEYRLVGACYVQGVMGGEAMRRHKDSGDPDIEFRIR